MAAGELGESPTALRGEPWEAHLGQDLVRLQTGREIGHEEVRCGDVAPSRRTGDAKFGVENEGDQRQFARRIGVSEAAANRSSVPDRRTSDVACRRRKD